MVDIPSTVSFTYSFCISVRFLAYLSSIISLCSSKFVASCIFSSCKSFSNFSSASSLVSWSPILSNVNLYASSCNALRSSASFSLCAFLSARLCDLLCCLSWSFCSASSSAAIASFVLSICLSNSVIPSCILLLRV